MCKTVLITGASRGIGKAAARLFAQKGYKTAINYLHSEKEAFDLAEELGAGRGMSIALRADVGNPDQVNEMTERLLKEWGKIDVLVNNAAISQQKLFTDIEPDEWRQMFRINVDGVYNTCRSVVPGMISAKRGSIVNVSSMWGQVGASCEVHYSASKAAVIGFTKALAKELGPSGVRVNCVSPGVIVTDMNARLDEQTLCDLKDETPMCALGMPEDVANSVLFLAGDEARFITGQVLCPNGGFVV